MIRQGKQPFIIYAIVMLVIFAASRLAALRPQLGLITAALFLYVPILLLFIKKQQPSRYGIGGKGMIKSIGRALLLAVIVFPIYTAGFYLYMGHLYGIHVTLQGVHAALNRSLLRVALNGLLMVAIPEEVFYRGFMQSELRRGDGRRVRMLGAGLGGSVLITNALFAAGHLVVIPDIARLAVFFPGIAFSWLRERDDNIAGAVVFHWLSNLLSFVLFAAYYFAY